MIFPDDDVERMERAVLAVVFPRSGTWLIEAKAKLKCTQNGCTVLELKHKSGYWIRVYDIESNGCDKPAKYAEPKIEDNQQCNVREQDKHEHTRPNIGTRARMRCVRQS
jgi:hypothetical protein